MGTCCESQPQGENYTAKHDELIIEEDSKTLRLQNSSIQSPHLQESGSPADKLSPREKQYQEAKEPTRFDENEQPDSMMATHKAEVKQEEESQPQTQQEADTIDQTQQEQELLHSGTIVVKRSNNIEKEQQSEKSVLEEDKEEAQEEEVQEEEAQEEEAQKEEAQEEEAQEEEAQEEEAQEEEAQENDKEKADGMTLSYVESMWESWFIPAMEDFIRVPNKTLNCDPDFADNGLIEQAMEVTDSYIQKLQIEGLEKKIFHPEGMNPLIVYRYEPESYNKNIMFYGHLDKMPYDEPWEEGLSPTEPVIRGSRLYGRGSHDDGYAAFSTMLCLKAAQVRGAKLPRVVLILETEEESGSPSLEKLLEISEEFAGKPDCLFCLDSGCLDYERLWITSSFRGVAILDMEIQAAENGYHSGEVGGVVPETFRIVRTLLDRLDDFKTGDMVDQFQVEAPQWKIEEAEELVQLCGTELHDKFPMQEGVKYMHQDDLVKMYLNQVWNPNVAITGAGGLPEYTKAGNVVRASTTVRISCRTSPQQDSQEFMEKVKSILSEDIPYNAKITLKEVGTGNGFCMKEIEPELKSALTEASEAFFDNLPLGLYGEGGAIPFLSQLQGMYPEAQILAFGVGGPFSNAHAPNEFLELDYCKKLTCAMSRVLEACGQQ